MPQPEIEVEEIESGAVQAAAGVVFARHHGGNGHLKGRRRTRVEAYPEDMPLVRAIIRAAAWVLAGCERPPRARHLMDAHLERQAERFVERHRAEILRLAGALACESKLDDAAITKALASVSS